MSIDQIKDSVSIIDLTRYSPVIGEYEHPDGDRSKVDSESLIHIRVGKDVQCLNIITNPHVPTPVGLIISMRRPPLSSSLHYVDVRRSTPQHSAGRYWGGSAHSPDPTAQSAPQPMVERPVWTTPGHNPTATGPLGPQNSAFGALFWVHGPPPTK